MMIFEILEHWNKERDRQRRRDAEKFLLDCGIKYTCPSPGCYKIISKNQLTIMFYPKSAKIIWKNNCADKQHHFVNVRADKLLKQLRKLIQE